MMPTSSHHRYSAGAAPALLLLCLCLSLSSLGGVAHAGLVGVEHQAAAGGVGVEEEVCGSASASAAAGGACGGSAAGSGRGEEEEEEGLASVLPHDVQATPSTPSGANRQIVDEDDEDYAEGEEYYDDYEDEAYYATLADEPELEDDYDDEDLDFEDDEDFFDDGEDFYDEYEDLYDDEEDDEKEEMDDADIELGEEDEFGSDMGVRQKFGRISSSPADVEDRQRRLVVDARSYVKNQVMADPKLEKVRKLCRNKHENCAFWASLGECEHNPGYMNKNCAPMCSTCDQLHIATRCPMDPDAVDALYPGDLDRMFERILSDPYFVEQYRPTVLSRPSYPPGEGPDNTTYQLGLWLVQFHNIATPEECTRLIDLGGIRGYVRSADVGDEREDGTHDDSVNEGRTSTNAWCQDECYEDPAARAVMDRMENITGIPEGNHEHLQLLRYEPGQYYQQHNDYIEYQIDRPTGVRILTFYLYLNDVEEGGETEFPRLGLAVKPKAGTAVLWPSVFNDRPNEVDIRSDHTAKPVVKGVKYGYTKET